MKGAKESSPFSALSYQEQQEKWMSWRSMQLDYKPVHKEEILQENKELPPLVLPKAQMRQPPTISNAQPYRHAELDKLYARHRMATRQTASWQQVKNGSSESGQGQ